MSLGERIYKLRTEKNLSQGDLADMLEVSRQSVSKWENNSAVPDLEKIIKLSEIFNVSLDTLVKGKTTQVENMQNEPKVEETKDATRVENNFPPRKIAGTILLCMAFYTFVLHLAWRILKRPGICPAVSGMRNSLLCVKEKCRSVVCLDSIFPDGHFYVLCHRYQQVGGAVDFKVDAGTKLRQTVVCLGPCSGSWRNHYIYGNPAGQKAFCIGR